MLFDKMPNRLIVYWTELSVLVDDIVGMGCQDSELIVI